jgi:oligoendopeptidase F
MVQAQLRAVGDDLLDPRRADPLYWASKLHFFLPGVPFYNFPYTFGYLLSRGLFAEFKACGAEFLPRYEELLRQSGSHEAPELVKQTLGVDLEQPEFWARSIESLFGPLDRLEAELSPSQPPPAGNAVG